MIFLIEKAWFDSMVSIREPDYGYDPVGYVATEQEAKVIVENGGVEDRPWKAVSMFRYKPIEKYSTVQREKR